VLRGREIALGPGKADLLEAVAARGSLRAAARDLGMSYMRAWNLVRMMNRSFRDPLVLLSRGGRARGGARLTAAGKQILSFYRSMERAGVRAAAPAWKRLRALMHS
jgi:molybdate transport system regulatory protein